MNKQEIEKSLKRYLKKRISYTFSLLIAFLITGGFATASELNQKVLLSRIKEDREKLEKMLQENYKKEAALQKENLDLLKEADFYVKPLNGTLFSMPYFAKKSKNLILYKKVKMIYQKQENMHLIKIIFQVVG